MSNEEADTTVYTVLVNDEEQYSLWVAQRPVPAGWRNAGVTGTKEQCLEFVEKTWTDMRPLSLRKKMDATGSA